MHWFAQAPANIALIKYMGKKDNTTNLPDNASLSYTLNSLLSSVELTTHPGKKDKWEPLPIPGGQPFNLSIAAQQRFLHHLNYLKQEFNYHGSFIVRSANNFPQGSGLASSASSFAALTKCAIRALCDLQGKEPPTTLAQAQLSRVGSGSSCRSFFSPWALWDGANVNAIDLPFNQLHHQVIMISHEEKQVPSSEAHQRIKTSPHYSGRLTRATHNLKTLLSAFHDRDWHNIYQTCWHEFQDMHHLFASCDQPFSYMTVDTKKLLHQLQKHWHTHHDGPIVTMDAGPNIHLLYRPDQTAMAQQFKHDHLVGNYDVL